MEPQQPPPAARLVTTPNLDAPDDFYEALIEAHQGLSNEESYALNARLVLVLANHIGALPVLREAFAAARRAGSPATVAEAQAATPKSNPAAAPAATAVPAVPAAPAAAPVPGPVPAPAPAPAPASAPAPNSAPPKAAP